VSIDDDLRAAERAGDEFKAAAIRSRLGAKMRLERFRSYPSSPQDETEEQRDARIKVTPESDMGESIWFWCRSPGCETHHSFRTKLAKGEKGPLWTFNGDMEKPTFSPSLLYRFTRDRDNKPNPDGTYPNPVDVVCHLFLTNGQINYLGDCSHGLKGQVVPLPDLP